jgi:ubiquinone/menaquinone biosynthesis C-methylase UbiE
MYSLKTEYFDENFNSDWAALPYGPEETAKLGRLFKHIGPLKGKRILEPGCGTGRLTEILADHAGNEGLVVALDISRKMIEAASIRVNARSNIEVHMTSLEDYPMEEGFFDLIICHQVFPHFIDKYNALSILSKGLKNSGKIIVFHFINMAEINDFHRKAGTAVEKDMLPEDNEMRELFRKTGMEIELILDDELGYFLSAVKK